MAEHLISVVSQNHQHLRITYNGPIWDNEPWSTFPNRQGWEPALLLENHKGSIPHTYAEAMECWLFFGTLHASFGDIFQQNDFIRMAEQPYITTSCLHRYLDIALSRGKSKFLQNLRSTLNLVLIQIEKRRVCDCIRPSMLFAIVVLLGSLMNFFRGKSDVDNAFKGGMQFRYAVAAREWADGELIGQAWCPSDVGRFSDTSLHYFILRAYALQMIRPKMNNRAEVIHSKCTLVECADNYIDNHTYVTKHVRSDCNCEHVGPDIEAVKRILRKGGTPLVRISTSKDDTALKLDVVQYHPGRRYVAISHVWSDGLGNVRGNSLPLCQLNMLQRQGRDAIDLSPAFLPAADNPIIASATVLQHWAGSVAKLADQSTLVWIDTLCVPRERETRNLAIKGMKQAYANGQSPSQTIHTVLIISSLQDARVRF
jgi:hypothetical protein